MNIKNIFSKIKSKFVNFITNDLFLSIMFYTCNGLAILLCGFICVTTKSIALRILELIFVAMNSYCLAMNITRHIDNKLMDLMHSVNQDSFDLLKDMMNEMDRMAKENKELRTSLNQTIVNNALKNESEINHGFKLVENKTDKNK